MQDSDPPDTLPYQDWKGAGPLGVPIFALRLLGLIAALLLCFPVFYLWRILRLSNPWPRLFLTFVTYICGARRHVTGVPVRRDIVLLSNHTSWFDIPLLGGITGTSFVAKAEIARWPLVGWLCRLNNTVFIARSDRLGVTGQIDALRDALRHGWAVTIFPEGTTTEGRELLPFKAPLLAALNPPPAGIEVQPVFIDLGDAASDLAWVGDETALHNAWRLLSRPGSFDVTVRFLEPFDPRDFGNRKAIAAEARKRIAAALSASRRASPRV